MSRDSIIAAGRIFIEAGMESTCVITRETLGVVDPATGLETSTVDTIYTGECHLRFPFVRPEQSVAEGQTIARDRGVLSLPIIGDSSAVRANDTAVIAIGALDPSKTITARIETPFTQTLATARRFPVEVLS